MIHRVVGVPGGSEARAFAPRIPTRRSVSRPRLVDPLVGARDASVVLVSAPAGYGKSTLLAQWAAVDGRPFAWVELGAIHDDPVVLIEDVVAAIAEVVTFSPDLAGMLASPRPPIMTRVIPRLTRALRAVRHSFVLVLDDVQLVRAAAALEVIRAIVANLGPEAVIAVCTRGEAPFLTADLEARGAMVRIDAADLALNEHEASAMLRGAGLDLGPASLHEIVLASEGWAAGVAIAARVVARDGAVRHPVTPRGDHRLVSRYIREEVLRDRPSAIVDFLLATSVLERFSAELCDALRRADDSGPMLRQVLDENLFVIPLDARDEWFRYHTLFRDALVAELSRRSPDRMRELNRRASALALARGDGESAIHHALRAGDRGAAASIIWRFSPAGLSQGKAATLTRWLALFEPQEQRADVHLALTNAFVNVETRSDLVAEWADVVEVTRHEGPLSDGNPVEAMLAVLRATIASEGVASAGRHASVARALLVEDSPFMSMACLLEGAALHLQDDPAGRVRLEEALRRAWPAVPTIAVISAAWLGFAASLDGDWSAAASLADRAIDIIAGASLEEYGSSSIGHALAALTSAHAGAAADARRHQAHARRLLAIIGDVAPFFAVTVRLVLAKASLRLADEPTCFAMLAECRPLLPAVADAPLLIREIEAVQQARRRLPRGDVSSPGSLTSAELRILRFLPTHLTFRGIAEQIHVSRFTVKSQAMSIYRKLGVRSRSEAVERGIGLGLIDR